MEFEGVMSGFPAIGDPLGKRQSEDGSAKFEPAFFREFPRVCQKAECKLDCLVKEARIGGLFLLACGHSGFPYAVNSDSRFQDGGLN